RHRGRSRNCRWRGSSYEGRRREQRTRQYGAAADGHDHSRRPHYRRTPVDSMRRAFVLLSVMFFSGGSLPGQEAALSGPLEGFMFDAPTGSFRAVVGLPGSASLGPSILEGFGLGSVAPGKDYGLAFTDGQCTLVSGLGSTSASAYALPGAIANPEGVVWSA